MNRTHNSQSGSAIFLVLIGIALFAALSFVVAQSLRLSGNASTNADQEKMALYMSEMTQFLEAAKVKANAMIAVNDIYDLNLSFKSEKYVNGLGVELCQNDNANCTEEGCHVFSPENPEGIIPFVFDKVGSTLDLSATNEPANGSVIIAQLAIDKVGSTAQDLVLIVNGVRPEFCNFYNAKLGLTTSYTDTTTLSDIGETAGTSTGTAWGGCGSGGEFTGTDVFGDEATEFAGRKTFCTPRRPAGVTPTLGVVYVVKAY